MERRFYDFKIGSRWEFDADFNGDKRACVFAVADRLPDRTSVEYDIFRPPDPGATASMDEIWYLEDGYVLWGDYDDENDRANAWWRVYKIGSGQGDTWIGPRGQGGGANLGLASVTVPAGRYPDALHIRVTDDDQKTHDFYYAPEVGLVKWETKGSRGTSVLTLRKFTSGQ